ncbi:MAG TPA: tetratricopeptide repeat protein [Coleofasciculaceae cyanobacterium]
MPNGFADGVKTYRDADYRAAKKSFARLHAEHPENSRITYYLAISEAQLGRFQQARALYQEIITLDPKSEAASLAREGLQYLPAEQAAMDLPPRFQEQKRNPAPEGDAVSSSPPAQKQAVAAQPQAAPSPMANMSPQDWMMLQMMMGGQGGGGNGMNAMSPLMMMPQMGADPSNPNGMGNIDPSVMSNLLMNQMMQNFSLDGSKDQDR